MKRYSSAFAPHCARLFSACSIALILIAMSSAAQAQAFIDDNDGLLDVGESPRFPADPAATTGKLDLGGQTIQDLDGTNLLLNLQSLELWNNQVESIEAGDFSGLTNLLSLNLGRNQIASIEEGDFEGLTTCKHSTCKTIS